MLTYHLGYVSDRSGRGLVCRNHGPDGLGHPYGENSRHDHVEERLNDDEESGGRHALCRYLCLHHDGLDGPHQYRIAKKLKEVCGPTKSCIRIRGVEVMS